MNNHSTVIKINITGWQNTFEDFIPQSDGTQRLLFKYTRGSNLRMEPEPSQLLCPHGAPRQMLQPHPWAHKFKQLQTKIKDRTMTPTLPWKGFLTRSTPLVLPTRARAQAWGKSLLHLGVPGSSHVWGTRQAQQDGSANSLPEGPSARQALGKRLCTHAL